MSTREELKLAVNAATAALADAHAALNAFDTAIENNLFKSLDEASLILEDRLKNQAHADCEGSYNCGLYEYTQPFMVGDQKYIAALTCVYNRHDKTYYYVDGSYFSVKPLE